MKEKEIRKVIDFIREKKYLPGRSADGKPCHESWPECIFIKKCGEYKKEEKKAYSCETAGLFDVGYCCASCGKYEEFLVKEIKKQQTEASC